MSSCGTPICATWTRGGAASTTSGATTCSPGSLGMLQQRILAILRRHLAPEGVGFVWSNAFQGSHLHRVARDLMRYHGGNLPDAHQAVDEARAILAMAAAVQDQDPGPYAALLREEYIFVQCDA